MDIFLQPGELYFGDSDTCIRTVLGSCVSLTFWHPKLLGGGNMFPKLSAGKYHIGLNNIRMARKLVAQHGFNCMSEHLGGTGHRHVIFDIESGNV